MIYKKNKKLIIQKIGNKFTIFDENKSTLYTLNETASYIFKKILKGWGNDEIINSLAKDYQVNKIEAKKDFNQIILLLKNNRII